MIRPGNTGFLARYGDVKDFANAIDEFLDLDEKRRKELRKNCRHVAVEEYNHEKQARRYLAVFTSILEECRK